MQGFPAVGRFVSAIDFGNPDRSCTSSWVWLQATIGNNSVPPLLDLHFGHRIRSDPIFIEYLYDFICIYDPLLFYHIFRNHIKNETSTLFSSTNYNVTMNYCTVRAAAPTYDVLFPLVDSLIHEHRGLPFNNNG